MAEQQESDLPIVLPEQDFDPAARTPIARRPPFAENPGGSERADQDDDAAGEHPDLVLMDIRLRGEKDGVEAATEIRRQVDVPIVYLTAHSDCLTVERAKQTEHDGFILKPFHRQELQSTIEVALERHAIRTKANIQ